MSKRTEGIQDNRGTFTRTKCNINCCYLQVQQSFKFPVGRKQKKVKTWPEVRGFGAMFLFFHCLSHFAFFFLSFLQLWLRPAVFTGPADRQAGRQAGCWTNRLPTVTLTTAGCGVRHLHTPTHVPMCMHGEPRGHAHYPSNALHAAHTHTH